MSREIRCEARVDDRRQCPETLTTDGGDLSVAEFGWWVGDAVLCPPHADLFRPVPVAKAATA